MSGSGSRIHQNTCCISINKSTSLCICTGLRPSVIGSNILLAALRVASLCYQGMGQIIITSGEQPTTGCVVPSLHNSCLVPSNEFRPYSDLVFPELDFCEEKATRVSSYGSDHHQEWGATYNGLCSPEPTQFMPFSFK